jgi:hypothetical protein
LAKDLRNNAIFPELIEKCKIIHQWKEVTVTLCWNAFVNVLFPVQVLPAIPSTFTGALAFGRPNISFNISYSQIQLSNRTQ